MDRGQVKMSKRIELTQGQYTLVDDEDYDYLNQYSWLADRSTSETPFYARGTVNRKKVRMHRLIMNLEDPKLQIDHINGDTLDNRKCNLRIVTRSINMRNRRSFKGSYSKYLGVTWHKRDKKWIGQIMIEGKNISLGYHDTQEEAYQARLKYIKKHKLKGYENY
jgi:hypothetical protein